MGRLAARVDTLDKKKPRMVCHRYYVVQKPDMEAMDMAYQAQVEDPAFCKKVVQLVNASIRILNKLEKQYGYELSIDHACLVSDELKNAQDDIRDFVEERIQRPLYVPFIPDWDTNLNEDGFPFESEYCYPEDRKEYWEAKKRAEYEQQIIITN